MSFDKIKSTDLVESNFVENIINELNKLKPELQALATSLKETLAASSSPQTAAEVKKLKKEIADLNAATETYKNVTKEVSQAEKDQIAEKVRNQLESQKLRKEARLNIQASKDNKSAYEQLNATLEINRKKVKDLLASNKELTDADKDLIRETQDLDKKLKDIDKTTGQNNRSVGNYSDEIQKALGSTKVFAREQAALKSISEGLAPLFKMLGSDVSNAAKGFKDAKGGLQQMGAGLNVLKTSLIATGIGAFVVIVGSLIAYFSRFQAGIDFVNVKLAGLSTVVDVVLDSFMNLGKSIIDNLLPALNGFWNILKGIGSFDYQQIKKGFDDVKTAVNGIDPINIKNLAIEANKARIQAENLAEALIDLERSENRYGLVISQNNIKKQRALLIAKEEEFSINERIAALDEAKKLTEEEGKQAEFFAKAKLEILREQNKLSYTNEEAKKKEIAAEIEYNNIVAKNFTELKQFQRDYNRLLRERAAEEKRLAKELQDLKEKNAISEVNIDNKRTLQIVNNQDRINSFKATADRMAKEREQEELDALKRQEEAVKKFLQASQLVFEQVSKLFENRQKRDMEVLEQRINRQQQAIQFEQDLAARGMQNNLALEKENLAKMEAERERAEIRTRRRERAKAILQTYLKLIETDNPLVAIGKAAAIVNGLQGFYEGTDELGEKDGYRFKSSGKDPIMIAAQPGEMILNPKESDFVRNTVGTRKDLINFIKQNKSNTNTTFTNNHTVTTVKEINLKADIDSFGNVIFHLADQVNGKNTSTKMLKTHRI
jgi:hypothetical protein